tara:strand:+ start:802 stop:1143 length:342 start_codon:yes stop_codon:yes gene_type:complete
MSITFFLRKILLFLYICLIFLLSSIPIGVVNSIQIYGLDKFFHLLEYSFLGFLFKYSIQKNISIYYVLIFLIPLIDEFIIQNFSGRNVDIYDFLVDIIGLIIGIAIKLIKDKN